MNELYGTTPVDISNQACHQAKSLGYSIQELVEAGLVLAKNSPKIVTTSMRERIWSWALILQADFRIFVNLTLPIRLHYAYDQARYAVACDEEACEHYAVKQPKLWRARCYVAGFTGGITCREIPEWFIGRWFSNAK